MKVYIAAPFFTPEQLAIVERVEGILDSHGIPYFSPRSGGVLKSMSKEEQAKTKKQIFDSNIYEMDDCDHMIACVEHRDTGTSFEIGYYYAKGKPITLFADDANRINVMLAEAAYSTCDDITKLCDSIHGKYSIEFKDFV